MTMIVAVFGRVLRPAATVSDLVEAWKPVDARTYPAEVEVAVDPANDRRVVTIIRFSGSMDDFSAAMPNLVRPDSGERLEKVVESTELEAVYETVDVSV
jgi:hypothetical protein